uniref:Uncharacterized protein n=1 Tax=Nelumbo nucifera TaxID=4432 RepID=A0A822Z8N6_NELNU|nr:TPA_asm: hypothetical protein HUJ06_014042 [Nelumbo nucifera]
MKLLHTHLKEKSQYSDFTLFLGGFLINCRTQKKESREGEREDRCCSRKKKLS